MCEIDRTVEREEIVHALRIKSAIDNVEAKPGPVHCNKCGNTNDRAPAGFAVCSACMEEAR